MHGLANGNGMRNPFSLLTLKEEFILFGDRDQLLEELRQIDDLRFKILESRIIKIFPNFSLGTLIVQGMPGFVDGINVRLSTSELEPGRVKLSFSTKVRPEVYFLVAISIVALLVMLADDAGYETWLYTFGVLAAVFGWFLFIYRSQEQAVVRTLLKCLRRKYRVSAL